ncbi:MAG: ferrochelatase [Halobacteriales archaeon]
MTAGVVCLAFGEPAEPDRGAVVDYLEAIFRQNAELESPASDAEADARARQLAERRAPGLLEEYAAIGGSPLNEQAAATADALAHELADRGRDVETYLGLQYTEPSIEAAVEAARSDGVDRLVGLPLFPLCGPSTSVAALAELRTAADRPLEELSGWHRHPGYPRLRADNVATVAAERGLDLTDPGTALVCSAHGTPIHYLEDGSRYRTYVEEFCDALAALLGLEDYVLGYQNHANRDVPWTEPDVEDAVADLDAERIVVEPVSFLHEQSETLVELDDELRVEAEAQGLDFHRVPVPHDDPRIPALLADLVEPLLAGVDPGTYNLRACACRDGAVCLNAPLPGGT